VTLPAPTLPCPQCRAPVPVVNDHPYLSCEHCTAALFLDLSDYLLHVYARPRLDKRGVQAALRGALQSSEVRGKLDRLEAELVYLPYFLFATSHGVRSVPGIALEGRALAWNPKADSSGLEAYDAASTKGTIIMPTASVVDARAQLGEPSKEARLVHVPFYRVRYSNGDKPYSAVVNALDGSVSAGVLPPASSHAVTKSYMTWAGLAFGVFVLEAALLPGAGAPVLGIGLTTLIAWWGLRGIQRVER
jgi:hypothetical protein